MKSIKSEDLLQGFTSKSKDLSLKHQGFHDELDEKLEILRTRSGKSDR